LSPPTDEATLTASLSTQIALRRHRLGILTSLMRGLPVAASALSTATPAALPIPAPRRESSNRMQRPPLSYDGSPAALAVAEARARGATDYDTPSSRRFLPASWGSRFDDDSSTRFPVPTWADDKWVEEARMLLAMSHRHPGIV